MLAVISRASQMYGEGESRVAIDYLREDRR